jgi:hypothetical protein
VNLKDLTPTLRVVLVLTLVGMILGAIVALTIFGKETEGVYLFGGSILIGLGIVAGVGGQLATNTNGNTSSMLAMLAEAQRTNAQLVANSAAMMALMTPSSKEAEAKVIEMTAVTRDATAPVSPAPVDNMAYASTGEIPRAPYSP